MGCGAGFAADSGDVGKDFRVGEDSRLGFKDLERNSYKLLDAVDVDKVILTFI